LPGYADTWGICLEIYKVNFMGMQRVKYQDVGGDTKLVAELR